MHIQTMRGFRTLPEPGQTSWEDLVGWLTDVQPTSTPKDDLGGWVPVKLKPGTNRRQNKNVEHVSCLVLDYDDIGIDQWAKALEAVEGCDYCYHSSYSHEPEHGRLRYRLVVRLDRPVPAEDWQRFYEVVAEWMSVGLNHNRKDPSKPQPQPDPQCKDLARFFYGPWMPEGAVPDAGVGYGASLPVDDVLAAARPRNALTNKGAAGHINKGKLEYSDIARLIPKSARRIENDFIRTGWLALQSALNREEFAPQGQRDMALLAMSAVLSEALPSYTAEAIVAPIAEYLDVNEPEPGWPAQALMDKLERDLDKIAGSAEGTQLNAARKLGMGHGYEADQVDQWVRDMGLSSREELAQQLIIVSAAEFYIFRNGDYVHVGTKERGEYEISALLAAAANVLPVSVGEITPNGWKDKPIKQLVDEYGRVVARVHKDLKIQRSRLEGDEFYYAVCPRDPKLVPRYDRHVQAWLESWGEPALIDWCATAARLEKPTAALIVAGGKRTGKSQLARGVARIWGKEMYTPLKDLTASFNESLSRCPVLYAEETVPWEFRRDTGLLKDLVTSERQQLRQKYQNTSTLQGSVRLMIARNDHKLFEAGEALTKDNVDALRERLLYVDTGYAPAPYFESEAIAEHLLWLEQNHEVPQSDRPGLWVSGKPSRLHHRMRAFTSKVSISVCQWLLNFLEEPHLCADTGNKQHRLDSQGFLITPKLIYKRWETYASKELRQPTLHQVADALAGISARKGHFFDVDLDVLAEYADHIGDPMADVSLLRSTIEKFNVELDKQRRPN